MPTTAEAPGAGRERQVVMLTPSEREALRDLAERNYRSLSQEARLAVRRQP